MTIQEINRGFEFLRKQVEKTGVYPGEIFYRTPAFPAALAPEALELAIRSAYDERLLSSTSLYTSISTWASVNGKTVFKTP